MLLYVAMEGAIFKHSKLIALGWAQNDVVRTSLFIPHMKRKNLFELQYVH